MVGPMDGIYLLNKTRIMSTCRSDGRVLKPDKPLTVVDSCFLRRDPTCFIYETHSDIKDYGRVHYYFNNANGASISPADVYLSADPAKSHLVYNWYTREIHHMGSAVNLSSGYEGHVYATVVPVVSDWAFLGEVDKYVTAASIRFSKVAVADVGFGLTTLTASVAGVKGETVRVCAVNAVDMSITC